MKRLIVFSVIAIAAGSARASEIPFFTSPDVPDYTARMIVHENYSKEGGRQRIVQHHNGWTHIEEERGDETDVYYGHFFKNVILTANRKDGEITSFMVRQVEPSQDYYGIREVKEIDDVETVGGEQCRWREFIRGKPQKGFSGPFYLSCLTGDGIEVATKVLLSRGEVTSETRLVELQRGPVPETAIRPPLQLFTASNWLKPLSGYEDYTPNAPDFDARLVSDRSEERLLRHYPWWLRQRSREDGFILITVWNEREDQGLQYSLSKGQREFRGVRSLANPGQFFRRFDGVYGMADMGKQERLLGEDCAWFDRQPDSADAGLWQCLTSDGIPLIDNHWSGWGDGEIFRIVSLTRRPVHMDEMQPPHEYLDPASWGFVGAQ
ncbi:hypothetical protein FHX15_002005 [Rhizobium sp. BK650]|uniref:hypothetical protein n=1 Tax=Rhizobium sp. BK650 TaxID=2586990 RepID=UPI00161A7176|nr:hypothetical protein [Rhizobium sp. BK650]MBB3656777.1 hypothetical protein [Rhizobium sp. BK650]